MKTSELTGVALDFVVDQIAHPGKTYAEWKARNYRRYSVEWAHGGPIIERERLSVMLTPKAGGGNHWIAALEQDYPYFFREGTTPLIAAMRCFVASKLGDEVEVPQKLME